MVVGERKKNKGRATLEADEKKTKKRHKKKKIKRRTHLRKCEAAVWQGHWRGRRREELQHPSVGAREEWLDGQGSELASGMWRNGLKDDGWLRKFMDDSFRGGGFRWNLVEARSEKMDLGFGGERNERKKKRHGGVIFGVLIWRHEERAGVFRVGQARNLEIRKSMKGEREEGKSLGVQFGARKMEERETLGRERLGSHCC